MNSCEKEEEANNPVVGTWEFSKVSNIGYSIVATVIFMADMTMTSTFTTEFNDVTNTETHHYTYSYTDTELTTKEEREPEEVSDYRNAGN